MHASNPQPACRLAHATGPVIVVLNAGAGHGDVQEICASIAGVLRSASRDHEILVVTEAAKLSEVAKQAVALAQARDGIVVAAGGDGTLNTVAQATLGSGRPFGVIPLGTFNYFGRAHGIAADPAQAAQALLSAQAQPIQIGLVNGRAFLVNASLGLYPKLLEDREREKRVFGRHRLVALWAALVTLVSGLRPMRIKLESPDRVETLRALMVFVGNNRLQLAQLGLEEAGEVEAGKLAVLVVGAVSTAKLLWLALKSALGNLGGGDGGVRSFCLTELSITPANPRRTRVKVATDGETSWMDAPLRFHAAPHALLLLKPTDATP